PASGHRDDGHGVPVHGGLDRQAVRVVCAVRRHWLASSSSVMSLISSWVALVWLSLTVSTIQPTTAPVIWSTTAATTNPPTPPVGAPAAAATNMRPPPRTTLPPALAPSTTRACWYRSPRSVSDIIG